MLLLLLTLLLKLPPDGPPKVRVTFNSLTEAAYVATGNAPVATKPRITFPLKKQQGRIVIPLPKGQKVYQDKGQGEDDSQQVHYEYRGYRPQVRCHLIRVRYYETEEWLLIDSLGHAVKLCGEPLFAPDMQHVVAASEGLEYGGGQPNKVQLLEIRNGALREIWSLEPKTWEPQSLCWMSNNVLLVTKEMWTEKSQGTQYTYAKLTIAP